MSEGDCYKSGTVSVYKSGYSWMEKDEDVLRDEDELINYNKAPFVISLPHQCDSWVVGDTSKVWDLIVDLLWALGEIERLKEGK